MCEPTEEELGETVIELTRRGNLADSPREAQHSAGPPKARLRRFYFRSAFGLTATAAEHFCRSNSQRAHDYRVAHGLNEPRLFLDCLLQYLRVLRASVVHQARGVVRTHSARISGSEAELTGDIGRAAAGGECAEQPAQQTLAVLRCGLVVGVARRILELVVRQLAEIFRGALVVGLISKSRSSGFVETKRSCNCWASLSSIVPPPPKRFMKSSTVPGIVSVGFEG